MKKNRKELHYVRAMLCILIITTHLLTEYTLAHAEEPRNIQTLYWIRMLIIFGTPGFLMLTQLLLTLNYKNQLPNNYLFDRMKYILIPYLIVGAFYSYSEHLFTRTSYRQQFTESVLQGYWHGYFILIIVKFFMLNIIIYKIKPEILNSKLCVLIAIFINIIYLLQFNDTKWMSTHYFFSPNTILCGWIGYYFVGGYIGWNYERIKTLMHNAKYLYIFLLILSYFCFIFIGKHDFSIVSSNIAFILPYSVLAFLGLIIIADNIQGIYYNIVMMISSYSFFIYLFHPLILHYIYSFTERFEGSTFIFVIISLILIISICIGLGIILSEFKIFKYVIGKQPYYKNKKRNVT